MRGGGDGGDGAGTAKVVGLREKKESEVSVVVKKNEQSEVWVEVKRKNTRKKMSNKGNSLSRPTSLTSSPTAPQLPTLSVSKQLLSGMGSEALQALVAGGGKTYLVFDSGAGQSFTGTRSHLRGVVRACHEQVAGLDPAGKMVAKAVGAGGVKAEGTLFDLDVLYWVPGMNCTLVSLSALVEAGWRITIAKDNDVNAITLERQGVVCVVPMRNGLYQCPAEVWDHPDAIWVDADGLEPAANALQGFRAGVGGRRATNTYTGGMDKAELLHRRLGHVSWGNAKWARRLRCIHGHKLGRGHVKAACEYCMRAKMTRVVSRQCPTRPATRPLERVHFDLSPSVPTVGTEGETGFCLLVDEYTGRKFARMIQRKSEVASILKEFKIWAETHFRVKLGEVVLLAGLRSDNESVNICHEVVDWCVANGISHDKSVIYEQWQNGVVERAMRTVWEGSEAMRKDAGAPASFWPHSIQAFVHTFSLLALGDRERSPYELWWDKDIPIERRLSSLRIWGSLCYAHVPKEKRKKLDDKARVCVHLGYSRDRKAYKLLELSTGLIFDAVSVAFDETRSPLRELTTVRTKGTRRPLEAAASLLKLLPRVAESAREAEACAEDVDDAARLLQLPPRVAESARVAEARAEDVDVAAGLPQRPPRVAENAREAEARAEDVDDAARLLQLPPRVAESAREAEACAEDVEAAARLRQMPPLESPSDHGFEPFGIPSSELDEHKFPTTEPGLPDLDHCFVEGRGVQHVVGHINGYQLHETWDEDGNLHPYVTQMFRCQWRRQDGSSAKGEGTWEPLSGLAGAREAMELYKKRKGSANQLAVLRRRHKGKVLGFDYVPGLPSPSLPTSSPPALSPPSSPPPSPTVAVQTPSKDLDFANVNPNLILKGSRRSLHALRAELATVSVEPTGVGEIEYGIDGEVIVPRIDPNAAKKFALSARLDGPVMDDDALSKVAERIRLLALVASANTPSFEEEDRAAGDHSQPRSFREAMGSVHAAAWMRAMTREMDSMEEFGVWKLEPADPSKNIMSCKWIYDIKRDIKGEVLKLKARLTARGFTQREGRDFGATWAPTCRMRVFRMMMAEASSDPAIMTAQWDLSTAFLHADMKSPEGVYMSQPPGFSQPSSEGEARIVCHLLKAIYGCKQSSRLFHELVRDSLKEMGAVQAKADECLFTFRDGDSWLKILVHVDDFACTFNDRGIYDRVFAQMQAKFKITDYGGGPITRFVGVCVERTPEGHYRLHQSPYITQVLDRLGLTDCKHALSPERAGTEARLAPYEGELSAAEKSFMAAVPYKEAVGALFYLARSTRFDIAHACGQVARFMDRPCAKHWRAVIRIYGYLARTKNVALVMSSRGMECELADQFLDGMSDSDWAGCAETRKSHTGWVVRVGGSLVSWYSKRQGSVSQSTAEAEYVAAAAVANEVIWWRRLCTDMGYSFKGPVTIWCDNRAATTLADHEGRFDAVKHIQLRYHVLRDYQKRGLVQVRWRSSRYMWADVLTKNCQPKHFRNIVTQLMGEKV